MNQWPTGKDLSAFPFSDELLVFARVAVAKAEAWQGEGAPVLDRPGEKTTATALVGSLPRSDVTLQELAEMLGQELSFPAFFLTAPRSNSRKFKYSG